MDKIDYLRVPSMHDFLGKGATKQEGKGQTKTEMASKATGKQEGLLRANSKQDLLSKRPDVKILFLGAKNVGKTGLCILLYI